VNGATLLGMDPALLRVRAAQGEPEKSVMEHIEGLARALAELKRAIGASDWPGVADALEYDLKDQADRWRAVMNALADEIGRRAAAGS
jgi:alpha-glucuronidase